MIQQGMINITKGMRRTTTIIGNRVRSYDVNAEAVRKDLAVLAAQADDLLRALNAMEAPLRGENQTPVANS